MELLTHKDKYMEYTYYMDDSGQVKHGLCKRWWSNGQLEWECNFKDGKERGLYRYWDKDGRLEKESYYWKGVEFDKEAYEEVLVTSRSW